MEHARLDTRISPIGSEARPKVKVVTGTFSLKSPLGGGVIESSVLGSRPIKIIYIAGSGRSGSTLLGRILGQIDGFTFLGELRHYWESGVAAQSETERCGCGLPFSDCRFWSEVQRRCTGLPGPEEGRALKRSVDRSRYIPAMLGWIGTAEFRTRLDRYVDLIRQLLKAAADVSGAEFVVDASKDPSFLYLLSCVGDLDVTVVHLVRDPRGVAYSWMKKVARIEFSTQSVLMRRQTVRQSVAFWDFTNLLAESSRRVHPRYLRVRYEDLVRDPRKSIDAICRLSEAGAPDLTFLHERTADLRRITHTMSGNPSRFTAGRTELKPDQEWKTSMRVSHKIAATLLSFPLLVRYGYLGR